jgi:hypothetical protein
VIGRGHISSIPGDEPHSVFLEPASKRKRLVSSRLATLIPGQTWKLAAILLYVQLFPSEGLEGPSTAPVCSKCPNLRGWVKGRPQALGRKHPASRHRG